MNPTTRKIILEHVQVAKTAACRMRHFYRACRIDDEGYERIRVLDQAISTVESYFFNQPEDPPEEHPLIWALRTGLNSDKDINDEDIVALVRKTLTLHTYQVTLPGSTEVIEYKAPNIDAVFDKYSGASVREVVNGSESE